MTENEFTDLYLRRGEEAHFGAFQIVADAIAEPGHIVPVEFEQRIAAELARRSPLRRISQVVRTGSGGTRRVVGGGTDGGWTDDDLKPPLAPELNEISPPAGDLYSNPAASQSMLDDAGFDLEEWLAGEIAGEFARAEAGAFVCGSGTDRPKGFLSSPVAVDADADRPFGTVQYLPSGSSFGLGGHPGELLIDLVHTLKSVFRAGASWVMNSATLAIIRKLKTADGAFLWQPGLVEGQPDRLLGYPVVEVEDMPDIADGAFPIAFGDFQRGYLIAERNATHILRDPFTNKPFVHFYATKRVGGQVLDSAAIKLLKIGG